MTHPKTIKRSYPFIEQLANRKQRWWVHLEQYDEGGTAFVLTIYRSRKNRKKMHDDDIVFCSEITISLVEQNAMIWIDEAGKYFDIYRRAFNAGKLAYGCATTTCHICNEEIARWADLGDDGCPDCRNVMYDDEGNRRITAAEAHDALVEIHKSGGMRTNDALKAVGGHPSPRSKDYDAIRAGFLLMIAGIASGDFVRGFKNKKAAVAEAKEKVAELSKIRASVSSTVAA